MNNRHCAFLSTGLVLGRRSLTRTVYVSKSSSSFTPVGVRLGMLNLHPRSARSNRKAMNVRALASATSSAVNVVPKAAPQVKYLKDYLPPVYEVSTVDLRFELDDPDTTVTAKLVMSQNKAFTGKQPIVLFGDKGLDLVPGSLKVDGRALKMSEYAVTADSLTIFASALPDGGADDEVTIESAVKIRPAENKALEGLYKSGGNYCTQCEAEGFRRITFYPDRPDVMSIFSTTIVADKKQYPVLLGNGNKVEEGDLEGGKHYAKYFDPWRKPSYLFALVAGDLVYAEDTFTTCSGREVVLKIFVRDGDLPKTGHAMDSLKRSMKWDEDVYGREYDLDIFNVVAVDDFNMGAMENKSLNIFNSRCVLVSPETATDSDFNSVEGIIAHEYFHNWTGNRVTCRDWFQLSLKEGLTVFRDQCFSADMNSKAVKRIGEVSGLRAGQFAEDAGPMAHPIRPDSFIEINNFYTQTVYSKGAEVIRMLHTILGPEGFRKGTDLYFERHDGQAVTCEDWLNAMQSANPEVDLSVFRGWYSQAGTPTVSVSKEYDEGKREMNIIMEQSLPDVPGQTTKNLLHIPVSVGLISASGEPLDVDVGDGSPRETKVLSLKNVKDTFTLKNVPEGAVLSILRDFSAPVKLIIDGGLSEEDLAFLMAYDKNEFNRWEAGQRLGLQTIMNYTDQLSNSELEAEDLEPLRATVVSAFRAVLEDEVTDPALIARLLMLPSEGYIAQQFTMADPLAIHAARDHVRKCLATELRPQFEAVLKRTEDLGEYSVDATAQGKRALHNAALAFLSCLKTPELYAYCLEKVRAARNMTDVLGALSVLSSSTSPERDIALDEFYGKWKHDNLVVLKWLGIQAGASRADALDVVKKLMDHEAFDITVPNKVYSVIGGFCSGNPYGFHTAGEEGYNFLADTVIKLDGLNPQVASRMAKIFTQWKRFTPKRQEMMKKAIERIAEKDGLSGDVYEVVTKSLA